MGWASAGDIFDPVAQALIDLGADRGTKRRVLGTLIDKLRDGDWDTCDESLQEFGHDADIVALFVERGIGSDIDGNETEGLLGYDARNVLWTLDCHGRNGCGRLGTSDGSSPEEHDRLIRLYAQHDAEQHGGDGQVPDWMLINP